ncbi:hypothetical protein [Chryseobacterium sp. Bi04]|uniref:hypothetical protein n=1 Tax=Chryseobacterium sp. Bi04 TaxID=2822345 RepID=UPI001DB236C1|nr:hypothetical protein [Chryseobacterium sp. Bi04]CAH0271843.1 hypothetical protein SRABI04_03791 [Chryseobacterium sp. Bi04]
MFPFTYTFKRKITADKTLEDVINALCSSFTERSVNDIHIDGNTITGKDNLIKLDFSQRSLLVLSPGKEYFIYNENTKILTFKTEAFYPTLFNVIYAGILFLLLYNFVHHLIIELVVPILFFILITIVSYFQHQEVIDKASRILNEHQV